jgi:hypothetical protein
MGQLDDLPGESWGDRLLEQNLETLSQKLRQGLDSGEYAEQQLSGFGNSTQSLLVMNKEASLTRQDLDDSALSLLVQQGRIHVQTDDAHLHPDSGTNLFLLPNQNYELQAVEPSVLIATFMRYG